MLNKKQKKQLKSLANRCEYKFQFGKNDISEAFILTLSNGLDAHELIKVCVLKTASISTEELADSLSAKLNAEVVQIVGHVITLYRQNKDKNVIQLVK